MDERSLPADPQGWCSWHRRCDGGHLSDKPGSQSLGPSGPHQVGSLQSAASAEDIYSEGGWLASAARHPHAPVELHSFPTNLWVRLKSSTLFIPCAASGSTF